MGRSPGATNSRCARTGRGRGAGVGDHARRLRGGPRERSGGRSWRSATSTASTGATPTSWPGSGPGPTRAGVPALALTFDPHPVALLRPESAPVPLTWLDRRLDLMRAAGATEVGVFRTGPWLLGLTAREFFDRVIVGQLGARGMVEGPNFGFGRDRGGDAALLGAWCAEAGLDFEVASTDRGRRPDRLLDPDPPGPRRRRGRRGRPPARPPAPDPGDRHPRRRPRRRDRRPDRQPRRDRHRHPRRRRLRGPGHRRRPRRADPRRLQHRPEPHLRRADPQGRGPPDRLPGRPLRPDGRARHPRPAPPDPPVRGPRRPPRPDQARRRAGARGVFAGPLGRIRTNTISRSRQ